MASARWMAFKKSAVRSRLYPPKTFEILGFGGFLVYGTHFAQLFRTACVQKALTEAIRLTIIEIS